MKRCSLKQSARWSAGIFLFSLACVGLAAGADTPGLRTEVVHIDSPIPGLKLALLHEFPVRAKESAPPIVLFAEGSSVPTTANAGFKIRGVSWMDDLAAHGLDVWSFDYLGYGKSSRYPDSESGPAVGRASDCASQMEVAARYILKYRKAQKLSLIGDSFGSLVAGIVAARSPELVDKLILVGPVTPAAQAHPTPVPQTATFEPVTVDDIWQAYSSWLPKGEFAGLDHDFFLKDWGPQFLATDPASRRRDPPSVTVPNGPDVDMAEIANGKFPYEPDKITAPTLLIYGEWDRVTTEEGAKRLFDALTRAQLKQRIVVGHSTHILQFENGRFQLYREMESFLLSRSYVDVSQPRMYYPGLRCPSAEARAAASRGVIMREGTQNEPSEDSLIGSPVVVLGHAGPGRQSGYAGRDPR